MDFFTRMRDAASRLARSSLASHSARGVHIAAIDLDVGAGGATCLATYHLVSEGDPDGKPLLFDCLSVPGVIQHVESSVADVRLQMMRAPRSRASILELTLRPNRAWDGAVVRFRMGGDVEAGGAPDCLVVPDFLPQLLSTPDAEVPLPEIRIASLDPRLTIAGVPSGGPPGSWLQGVLFPSVAVHPHSSRDARITLNRRYFGQLRVGEVHRAERLTETIYDFLAGFLGCDPHATIYATSSELLRGAVLEPTGAVLVSKAAYFGLRGREPADVQLAMRLAGIWWGGGIRLQGRNSREIESAIRAAAGLAWARYIGETTAHEAALKNIEDVLRSRMPTFVEKAEGSVSRKLIAKTVKRLVDAGATEPASSYLRRRTVSRWGHIIPSSVVWD